MWLESIPTAEGGIEKLRCDQCAKIFYKRNMQGKYADKLMFCSDRCKKDHRNQMLRLKREMRRWQVDLLDQAYRKVQNGKINVPE